MWSDLLSGTSLSVYRDGGDQVIPSRGGQKDTDPDGSWLQARRLDTFYEDLTGMLVEERVEKRGSLVVGEWSPLRGLVEFQKELGKFWIHMGFADTGRKWLYPEEALYLMDTKVLQVNYQGLPVSIQEAYTTFFTNTRTTLQQYQVYAHLRRLGYILKRHHRRINTDSAEDSESVEGEVSDTATGKLHTQPIPGESYDASPLKYTPCKLPHSVWDFSQIHLPDIGGKLALNLTAPDQCYIPETIQLSSENYTIDQSKISADSQATRKKRRDDTEFPDLTYSCASKPVLGKTCNWTEYKSELLESSGIGVLDRPDDVLWKGDATPLVSAADSSGSIMEKLRIIKKASYDTLTGEGRFKKLYDVFLPNTKFKKSNPGLPSHHVCVARQEEAPPTLHDLAHAYSDTSTPIVWAVVSDGGHISVCGSQEETPPILHDLAHAYSDTSTPIVWAVVSDGGDISFMTFQPVDISLHNSNR